MHRRKNLLHRRAQTVTHKPKSCCGKDEVQKALFFSTPHCSQYHKKQAKQETVERLQKSAGRHKVTTFDVSWMQGVQKSCKEGSHAWMPPMRSERVGFLMSRASSPPCAVATSCTPRCAMLRAANASASVPISS